MKNYSLLPKSYKCAFPFNVCTTSFIYPEDYIPNVQMVGPFVDEIELLFFESGKASLPNKSVIKKLHNLSKDLNVTYNIHLPADIYPGSPDSGKRQIAVESLNQIFDITRSLDPTTYTLHLPMESGQEKMPDRWLDNIHMSLDQLIGKSVPGEKISVETLSYPLDLAAPVIDAFHLSVCLDLGHLIIYGYDVVDTFSAWLKKTTIIHFHGVENGKDHISLERMNKSMFNSIMGLLSRFSGIVSIEVFSFEDLKSSLLCLENHKGV